MNSLPELVFSSIGAFLVVILLECLPQPQQCVEIDYIQRSTHQHYKACWDGSTLEISDTGMAKADTAWYNEHIQPKIDSLKNVQRN